MKIYNLDKELIFDGPVSELKGADLQGADLQGANLQGANLQRANLQEANLQEANLQRANLQRANLQRASLQGAGFQKTNLQRANLYGADFQDAYLRGADLRGADLRGADLQGADLQGADLQDIKTDHTTSYFNLQCPEKGSFVGFKKAYDDFIVELKVPASALRSSATSRKCRVSKAKVISITKGKEFIDSCHSNYDNSFIYKVGGFVEVKDFDKDRWNECSSGIHLFVTKAEAENY